MSPSDWHTGDSIERSFRDDDPEPETECDRCPAADECEELSQISGAKAYRPLLMRKLVGLIGRARHFMVCLREERK